MKLKYTIFTCLIILIGCAPKKASLFQNNSDQFRSKYASYLDTDEEIINSWYHYVTSKNSKGQYIVRTFFPETRQITSKKIYLDPELKILHGEQIHWNENGNKSNEGNKINNAEEGEWKYYHRTTGNLREIGKYRSGERTGEWKNYDTKGRITEILNYQNDVKEGKFIQFDSLGNEVNNGIYKSDTIFHQLKEDISKDIEIVEQIPYLKSCENISETELRRMCSDKTLLEFIYRNIRYPESARRYGVEGMAIAQFVVNKNGEVEDLEIIRGLCQDIKTECERIVRMLPKWSPGTQNNEPVKVLFTLPIRFKLEY